jgi:hypothetical protein
MVRISFDSRNFMFMVLPEECQDVHMARSVCTMLPSVATNEMENSPCSTMLCKWFNSITDIDRFIYSNVTTTMYYDKGQIEKAPWLQEALYSYN